MRARSRLYQRRFLRPNTHFAAFLNDFSRSTRLSTWISDFCKFSMPLHRFLCQKTCLILFYFVKLQGSKMSFFSSRSQWFFVGISRNDKDLKDLDERGTKSTVFSVNDLIIIYALCGKFQRIFDTVLFVSLPPKSLISLLFREIPTRIH